MSGQVPLSVWGLDGQYWSFVRLCVSQVERLQSFKDVAGALRFDTHPVFNVELMGVVVDIVVYSKVVRFQLDDSTGVIRCCWYYEKLENLPSRGDLVRVKGKLNLYQEEKSLFVSSYGIVRDANEELLHWCDVVHLTLNEYKKPSMVFKEVLHKDYLSYIVRHSLRQLKVVEFTKESLEELEEVQDALKRGNQTETLDAILADLTKKGVIKKDPNQEGTFQVVQAESDLDALWGTVRPRAKGADRD